MRKVWLSLVVLGVLAGVAGAKQRPRGEVVVKAKVTGLSSAPLCGIMHTAIVVRYDVLGVVRGKYAAPVLYAVYDCGAVAGQPNGVKVGDVHRLTVKPVPADFGASIIDAFAADDKALPRLLAVRADTVKP